MEPDQFQALLNAMLASVGVEDATRQYESLKKSDLSMVIILLYQNIEENTEKVQTLCAILLSHIFKDFRDHEIPEDLTEEALDCIFNKTICFFRNESFSQFLLTHISRFSAAVASAFLDVKMMKDFIPGLLAVAQEMHPVLSAAAIDCLGQILNYTTKQLKKYLETALNIITASIEQQVSEPFVLYSLNLLYNIILRVHPKINLSSYSGLIAPAIQLLVPTHSFPAAINSLSFFIQHRGTFFGEHIGEIVEILLQIISNPSHLSGTRNTTMEMLLWLARTNGQNFFPFLEDVYTAFLSLRDDFIDENYLEDDNVDLDNSIFDYADLSLLAMTQLYSSKTNFASLALGLIEQAIQSED